MVLTWGEFPHTVHLYARTPEGIISPVNRHARTHTTQATSTHTTQANKHTRARAHTHTQHTAHTHAHPHTRTYTHARRRETANGELALVHKEGEGGYGPITIALHPPAGEGPDGGGGGIVDGRYHIFARCAGGRRPCVCVCVRACVRARLCVCACVCAPARPRA